LNTDLAFLKVDTRGVKFQHYSLTPFLTSSISERLSL